MARASAQFHSDPGSVLLNQPPEAATQQKQSERIAQSHTLCLETQPVHQYLVPKVYNITELNEIAVNANRTLLHHFTNLLQENTATGIPKSILMRLEPNQWKLLNQVIPLRLHVIRQRWGT